MFYFIIINCKKADLAIMGLVHNRGIRLHSHLKFRYMYVKALSYKNTIYFTGFVAVNTRYMRILQYHLKNSFKYKYRVEKRTFQRIFHLIKDNISLPFRNW